MKARRQPYRGTSESSEVLRSLGRIEGELVEIRKLNERVWRLEMWQSWLKGGWAALAAAYAYIYKGIYGK
jgi:hypothetical protein